MAYWIVSVVNLRKTIDLGCFLDYYDAAAFIKQLNSPFSVVTMVTKTS